MYHLRMFYYPIITIGISINIHDGRCEWRGHVCRCPPRYEAAGIARTISSQGWRIEWQRRSIIVILLIRPGLMQIVFVTFVGIIIVVIRLLAAVLGVVRILIQFQCHAHGLLDLVHPGRFDIPLRRHDLAVHIGREVTVYIPARSDADRPRFILPPAAAVASVLVDVRQHRLEQRCLERGVLGVPVRVGIGPGKIEAE